jgi:hypothetical protein
MNEMAKIHAFLVEMERSLPFHSVKERHDILRETQSHLTERAGAGALTTLCRHWALLRPMPSNSPDLRNLFQTGFRYPDGP